MPKLHEILAVESNLENQANKTRQDILATFDKKRHLFEEKRVVFTPSAEGEQPVTEAQSDIQSSVGKELDWLTGHLQKALDASFQVAVANTQAMAPVLLEDASTPAGNAVLIENVPATALLELEKRMTEVRELVAAIPTLDPAKGFTLDPNREPGTFKAREVRKTRTKKIQRPLVLYAATTEHPAQVQLVSEDVPIGTVQEQEWSSLVTPARKAEMLARADALIRSIRRARSVANEVAVDTNRKIGAKLLNYIFKA